MEDISAPCFLVGRSLRMPFEYKNSLLYVESDFKTYPKHDGLDNHKNHAIQKRGSDKNGL